jgi:hypothetical protein
MAARESQQDANDWECDYIVISDSDTEVDINIHQQLSTNTYSTFHLAPSAMRTRAMAGREGFNQKANKPEPICIDLTDDSDKVTPLGKEGEHATFTQVLDDLERALILQQADAERALAEQQALIRPATSKNVKKKLTRQLARTGTIQARARTQIENAEEIIGYVFADKDILFEALQIAESGVRRIGKRKIPDSNMRLAMIGDSILQTLIVEDRYAKEWTRSTVPLHCFV